MRTRGRVGQKVEVAVNRSLVKKGTQKYPLSQDCGEWIPPNYAAQKNIGGERGRHVIVKSLSEANNNGDRCRLQAQR